MGFRGAEGRKKTPPLASVLMCLLLLTETVSVFVPVVYSSQPAPTDTGSQLYGPALSFQEEEVHYCGTTNSVPGCVTNTTPFGINNDAYEFKLTYTSSGNPQLWFLHFPICNCTVSPSTPITTTRQFSINGTVLTLTITLNNGTQVLALTFNQNTGYQQLKLLNLNAIAQGNGAQMGFIYYGGVANGETFTLTPYTDGVYGANKSGNYLTKSYSFSYTVFGSAKLVLPSGSTFVGAAPGSILHRWGYLNYFRSTENLEDQWDIIGASSSSSPPAFILNLGDVLDFWGARTQLGGALWFNGLTQEGLGFSNGKAAYVISPNTGSNPCSTFSFGVPTTKGLLSGVLTAKAKLGGGCSFEQGYFTGSLTVAGTTYQAIGLDFEFGCVSANLTNCTNALISTTTTVSCAPSTDPVGVQTSCLASVSSADPGILAIGSVQFSSPSGTFTPRTCTLSSSHCSVMFAPSSGTEGSVPVTATYVTDPSHTSSTGSSSVQAIVRTSSIGISCTPSTVPVGVSSSCVAMVQDTSLGVALTPTGIVNISLSPSGLGELNESTCSLDVSGSCAFSYSPTVAGSSANITGNYPGDTNHGSSSARVMISAGAASAVLTQSLSPGNVVTSGTPVYDNASLSDVTPAAGGTVNFYYVAGSTCSSGSPVAIATPVTVFGPGSYTSAAVRLNGTGQYYLFAVYSGDPNNTAASSACSSLRITSAAPAISIALTNSAIFVGGSVSANSTLTGATPSAGGEVAYQYFTSPSCSGSSVTFAEVTVSDGVVPSSGKTTFNSAGIYYMLANYTGDTEDSPALSGCISLNVAQLAPAISSSVTPTTLTAGGFITASAALSGESPTAGGSITYSLFDGGACSGVPASMGSVAVANGDAPSSPPTFMNIAGSFGVEASYSGDPNNLGATSACVSVLVNPAPTTVATVLSMSSIPAGGSVFDTASLSGQTPSAGGIVTYQYFSNGACTGSPTVVGTYVPVTDGKVPNSTSQIFGTGGNYGWEAVYSGDPNNFGATSPCEPLSVTTASPHATSLTLSPNSKSVIIGSSDSIKISVKDTTTSPTTPTGTITWSDNGAGGTFSPTTCTLSGSTNPSTCSVKYFPPPTEPSTHSVTITASYAGDSTHSGGSASTSLTILDTTTTVTLAPSCTEIAGNICPVTSTVTVKDLSLNGGAPKGSVTWSASTSGGSFTPGGTCTLSSVSTNSSSCTVTYNPPTGAMPGTITITAKYSGSGVYTSGQGTGKVVVSKRSVSIQVTATPSNPGPGTTVTLSVIVSDASSGTTSAPTGTVTLSDGGAGGTFSTTTCTLIALNSFQSTCSVTITYKTPASFTKITITAKYNGNSLFNSKSGSALLT